jgi:hypothetical protein
MGVLLLPIGTEVVMKTLIWMATVVMAGALSMPAQQGRGGEPLAFNDKDKDGICDVTNQPVGRNRSGMQAGRGQSAGRGPCGRGLGRGMAAGRGWGRGMAAGRGQGRGMAAGRGWGQNRQQAQPTETTPAEPAK